MAMVDWITLTYDGVDAPIVTADLHRYLSTFSSSGTYDAPYVLDPIRMDYRYPAVPARLTRLSSGRMMLTMWGSNAHVFVYWLIGQPLLATGISYSIARMDVQHTTVVPDADDLILGLQSSPRYQRLLLDPRPGRGSTLYVGSPKSRARIRVYNKSVQADIHPDDASGEYVRIELQARDIVAEQIFSALLLHPENIAETLHAVLHRKITAAIPSIANCLGMPVAEIPPDEERQSPRYAEWLFHTVLPALRRIELVDKALYQRFLNALSIQLDERDV